MCNTLVPKRWNVRTVEDEFVHIGLQAVRPQHDETVGQRQLVFFRPVSLHHGALVLAPVPDNLLHLSSLCLDGVNGDRP